MVHSWVVARALLGGRDDSEAQIHLILAALLGAALLRRLYAEDGWTPDYRTGWDTTPPDLQTAGLAGCEVIVVLTLIEAVFVCVLNAARESHPVLAEARNRSVLARILFSVVALCFIGYQGCAMYAELDWAKAVTAATPHKRLYAYIPRMHYTTVVMTAFQLKNLFDTIRWKDGPEFIAHHIATIVVGLLCFLQPGFCHVYGIFYFGISELSTAFVGALSAFDPHHGVATLAAHLPLTKMLLGAGFVVSFVAIRVVIWPLVSYQLVSDALVVLGDGTAHSVPVLLVISICLSGLTVLQFVWLREIYVRVREEIEQTMGTKGLGAIYKGKTP